MHRASQHPCQVASHLSSLSDKALTTTEVQVGRMRVTHSLDWTELKRPLSAISGILSHTIRLSGFPWRLASSSAYSFMPTLRSYIGLGFLLLMVFPGSQVSGFTGPEWICFPRPYSSISFHLFLTIESASEQRVVCLCIGFIPSFGKAVESWPLNL